MIQPADYIRGFAAGLVSKVDMFEHSPVLKLERLGGTWKASSRNGSVTAPKVILGVNGHIDDFGHFHGRLMHIFTYASMTAPFTSKSTGQGQVGLAAGRPHGRNGQEDLRRRILTHRHQDPVYLRLVRSGERETFSRHRCRAAGFA